MGVSIMYILRKSYISTFLGVMFAITSFVQAEDWSLLEATIGLFKYKGEIVLEDGTVISTNTEEKAVNAIPLVVHKNGGELPRSIIEEAVIFAEAIGKNIVVNTKKKTKKHSHSNKHETSAKDASKGALFLVALNLLGTNFKKMCKSSFPGFADIGTFLVNGTGSTFGFISKHKTASTVFVGVGAYLLYCWLIKSPVINKNWNSAFEQEQKPVRRTRTLVYNG